MEGSALQCESADTQVLIVAGGCTRAEMTHDQTMGSARALLRVNHTATGLSTDVQQIAHHNIAPLCQNGATNHDLRGGLPPAPSGAGCRCKPRLESSIRVNPVLRMLELSQIPFVAWAPELPIAVSVDDNVLEAVEGWYDESNGCRAQHQRTRISTQATFHTSTPCAKPLSFSVPHETFEPGYS